MIEAVNRTHGRAADDRGEFTRGVNLDDPSVQPLLRRVGENICPFSPIHRVEHAKNIVAAVLAGRERAAR